MYVCINVCMYVCMNLCMYVCMYVMCVYVSCTYVWMCICMYVCMHVCVCVCMHVCMYSAVIYFLHKMCGQTRHNTRSHARLPHSSMNMDALDNFKTECNFESQATWVIDVVGLFLRHDTDGCLYNQVLADIRSTGAGNKCLYMYCMYVYTKEK